MSFQSPIWLAALLLLPLGLAAYVQAQRRHRRYAVRFPAFATLRAAGADPRNAWRGHVPAVLLLAALAALALALARPHTTYQVAIDRASIVLVLDHSGSMASTDVAPTRIAAAQAAANAFIGRVPQGVRIGAVGFSTAPDAVQQPVLDHNAARQLLASQQPGGSTATGNALALALQLLHGTVKSHPPAAIVLLSDGAANAGQSPLTVARQASAERIPIDTVALGTPGGTLTFGPLGQVVPVPPDPQLMRAIARASGGRSFDAQTTGQLSSIYTHLGDQLGSVTRHREITADFAVAALVLLLAAAALSARFAGRLP